MFKAGAWQPQDGFRVLGPSSIEVYRKPGAMATTPGWRTLLEAEQTATRQLTVLVGAALLTVVFPDLAHEVLMVGMGLLGAAVAYERLGNRNPDGYLYRLSWDETGVQVTTKAGGTHAYPVEEIQSVVWEPVEYYGVLSRLPVALGGQVVLKLRSGEVIFVGSGFDHLKIRSLCERLATDLKLTMVEQLAMPLARTHDQLDKPVTGHLRALPRQWRKMPTYSNWDLSRTVWGSVLTIGSGAWKKEGFLEALDHYGTWLVAAVFLDLVRIPFMLWAGMLGIPVDGPFEFDPLDVVMHGLAIVPILYGMYRSQRPRRLNIDKEHLVYEEEGKVVATFPVSAIEQVRLETFPSHAVRIISDDQELVIKELPEQVDYEALADQLPHLLPTTPKEERTEAYLAPPKPEAAEPPKRNTRPLPEQLQVLPDKKRRAKDDDTSP